MVVLDGNRPKENTRQLADAFIQGAVDAGHEVKLVSLNQVKVKSCMGCNVCRYGKTCVQKDGFSTLSTAASLNCVLNSGSIPFYPLNAL